MGLYDDLDPKAKVAPAALAGGLYGDLLKPDAATPATKPDLLGSVKKLGETALKGAGNAYKYGRDHGLEVADAVLGSLQRPLEAVETGHNPVEALLNPKQAPMLRDAAYKRFGLDKMDRAYNPTQSLPDKLERAGRHGLFDIANDPMNLVGAAPFKLAAKGVRMVPGAVRAGEEMAKAVKPAAEAVSNVVDPLVKKVAESPIGTKASEMFDPRYYLRGLTPEAQKKVEVITNRAMEAVRKNQVVEDAIVKKHADEIRRGIMPDEVRDLFKGKSGDQHTDAWRQYFTDENGVFKQPTNPRDIQSALYRERATQFAGTTSEHGSGALQELKDAGFLEKPEYYAGLHSLGGRFQKIANPYTGMTTGEIEAAQGRLLSAIQAKLLPEQQSGVWQMLNQVTRRGNQAFLASPFPHMMNLANLSFNEHGLGNMLTGVGHAAQVATGKVSPKVAANVRQLEEMGAKSQYHNLFDELGITRVAGIPGSEPVANVLNKGIVPAERFANKMQNTFLNPLETGLRSAALEAETKLGRMPEEAAYNIHRTFGTGAPAKIVQDISRLAQPFAMFHGQTAPGSLRRTLVRNPNRVNTVQKSERNYNEQVNPGGSAQLRLNTPTFSGTRALTDPIGYYGTMGGALEQLGGPYSPLSLIKQGKLPEAAAVTGQRFVPSAATLQAIIDMARKKQGRAGEAPLGDLLTSLLSGGYYQKPKL